MSLSMEALHPDAGQTEFYRYAIDDGCVVVSSGADPENEKRVWLSPCMIDRLHEIGLGKIKEKKERRGHLLRPPPEAPAAPPEESAVTEGPHKISDKRPAIPDSMLKLVLSDFDFKLREQLDKKGRGSWLSQHEILGVVEEEHHELLDAIISNDHLAVKGELLDIAVACIFGAACITSGELHW